MDEELKQYLDHRFEAIESRLERTETKLLTAFHRWSRQREEQ